MNIYYRVGVGIDDLDGVRPPPLLVRRRGGGCGGGGPGGDAARPGLLWRLLRRLVVGRMRAAAAGGATGVRVVHSGRWGAVMVRGRSRRDHHVLGRLLVRLGWDPVRVRRGLTLGQLGHGNLEKRSIKIQCKRVPHINIEIMKLV